MATFPLRTLPLTLLLPADTFRCVDFPSSLPDAQSAALLPFPVAAFRKLNGLQLLVSAVSTS